MEFLYRNCLFNLDRDAVPDCENDQYDWPNPLDYRCTKYVLYTYNLQVLSNNNKLLNKVGRAKVFTPNSILGAESSIDN